MVPTTNRSDQTVLLARPVSASLAHDFVCVYLVTDHLVRWVDNVHLGVSELATNAVAHARTVAGSSPCGRRSPDQTSCEGPLIGHSAHSPYGASSDVLGLPVVSGRTDACVQSTPEKGDGPQYRWSGCWEPQRAEPPGEQSAFGHSTRTSKARRTRVLSSAR
jgi:hypothetical protein